MTEILIIVGLGVIASIVLVLMFIVYLRRRIKKAVKKMLLAAWNNAIVQSHPTLKIVEADKILDEALSQRGFTGSLGEKLKAAETLFSNIDAVWKAHKLRNSLVHDLQKQPHDKEVEEAMRAFRQGLQDLGV